MEKKKKYRLTATQNLVLGVIAIILIGAIILKLPISNTQGKDIRFLDSLFTSVSCTCVTGLNTIIPSEQFSIFGQVVLLVLIEIGGLGFMSFIALVLIFMRRKINLSDRIVIKESLNQNNTKGIIKLIKDIFIYTITFQTIGACTLAIRFIPEYGIGKGIFYSIFHSISAFCNAGFDVLGSNSLEKYQYDPIINITIMILIILGGLGFTVWSEVFNSIKKIIKRQVYLKKVWKEYSIHTKIVLIMTTTLLITGTLTTFLLEKNNIHVMKEDSFGHKVLKSSFYSTTLRTAGMYTVNPDNLTSTTKFISMAYMFTGASPASTGGGIKTVTLAILICMVISFVKGEEKLVIFKREIPFRLIKRTISIITISVCIVIASIVLLTITEQLFLEQNYSMISENIDFMDISYEVFSAFGTVGLTLGATPKFSMIGKMIIMILMFIGRLRTNYNIICIIC